MNRYGRVRPATRTRSLLNTKQSNRVITAGRDLQDVRSDKSNNNNNSNQHRGMIV